MSRSRQEIRSRDVEADGIEEFLQHQAEWAEKRELEAALTRAAFLQACGYFDGPEYSDWPR